MSFAGAVERGLLSDYKVLVLNIREDAVAATLQRAIAAGFAKELPLDDAAKLVGCASALFDPMATEGDANHRPLLRAISFSNTIRASKVIANEWAPLVNQSADLLAESSQSSRIRCEVEHVDGKMNALQRSSKLDWLRESEQNEYEVRVLSNARCLAEGVDVPALDAVLFMQPRRSQVDVVQAVGRVMRTAPRKQYGYVILPIAIPADEDAATALDNNKRYEVVWEVLQALRSHDERLDAEINQIDLNRAVSDRIQIVGVGTEETESTDASIGDIPTSFQYKLDGLVVDHFYARVVERVGDRQYWDKWAKDVAKVATTVQTRLRAMIPSNGESTTAHRTELKQRFNALLQAMRATTNDALTEDGALAIVAQHMITGPVFDALYPDYDFTSQNPVARSLGEFVDAMGDHGLDAEMQGLQKFYDSVRRRAEGIDNPNGRRKVLEELYENFFKAALPKEAERLGVVFTPHELVDYILHSVNDVLKQEFGKTLADEGVHILDPFAGMGTFIWRLIANPELIPDDALHRKYTQELHANEILPLAYYMATINIEEAYRERVAKMTGQGNGHRHEYEPFTGIVWRDTFNAPTDGGKASGRQTAMQFMQANDARARRQDETEMTVIVGNPPYSAWQKSADDDNPNTPYPDVRRRISDTYVSASRAKNTNSLHDHYKMAIRWATDRLTDADALIGFVTNNSFVDGNAESGMRVCLLNEFDSIHVFNLRGNARSSGRLRRMEAGNVFEAGTRAGIAMTIFKTSVLPSECKSAVYYHAVDDYLSRSEKLLTVASQKSVTRNLSWARINPDKFNDWVDQRDPQFVHNRALGSNGSHDLMGRGGIFKLHSSGIKSHRDVWVYGFSVRSVGNRLMSMLQRYNQALLAGLEAQLDDLSPLATRDPTKISWGDDLRKALNAKVRIDFQPRAIRRSGYRPFVRQYIYFDERVLGVTYRVREMYPPPNSINRSIYVPGVGGTREFSVTLTDDIPDLHLNEGGQAFPRHAYDEGPVTDIPNRAHGDTVQRNATQRNATQRNATQRNATSRPRENLAICVAGVGATKPFSTLVTDIVPDLELVTKGQCFPRYAYERIDGGRAG